MKRPGYEPGALLSKSITGRGRFFANKKDQQRSNSRQHVIPCPLKRRFCGFTLIELLAAFQDDASLRGASPGGLLSYKVMLEICSPASLSFWVVLLAGKM